MLDRQTRRLAASAFSIPLPGTRGQGSLSIHGNIGVLPLNSHLPCHTLPSLQKLVLRRRRKAPFCLPSKLAPSQLVEPISENAEFVTWHFVITRAISMHAFSQQRWCWWMELDTFLWHCAFFPRALLAILLSRWVASWAEKNIWLKNGIFYSTVCETTVFATINGQLPLLWTWNQQAAVWPQKSCVRSGRASPCANEEFKSVKLCKLVSFHTLCASDVTMHCWQVWWTGPFPGWISPHVQHSPLLKTLTLGGEAYQTSQPTKKCIYTWGQRRGRTSRRFMAPKANLSFSSSWSQAQKGASKFKGDEKSPSKLLPNTIPKSKTWSGTLPQLSFFSWPSIQIGRTKWYTVAGSF